MAAAVPVADVLAGGRETVRTYLIIGFMLLPLMLVGALLTDALVATQRWRAVVAATFLTFAPAFVGTVVLYAFGDLTVASASALTILGAIIGFVPAIPMLLSLGRPVFRLRTALQGIAFGAKAWAGGLALLANLRLDQVLMITLVAPRVLGLYTVAATLAGATALATGALAQPVIARVANGERLLMVRAVRMALLITALLNLILAALAPPLLTTVFGHEFRDAVPMTWVLLIGAVPFGAAGVLSGALQADGAPLVPSIAEGIALVVTVTGLLTLLRPLGGIGAAIVSVAAYTTSFGFQVAMARRRLDVPARHFLVPTSSDLRWIVAAISGVGQRVGRVGWATR
jgi:O-antigen/teichoic acid export membrane protein